MTDLISKQDAIDAIYKAGLLTFGRKDVRTIIEELPSAEKIGKWIENEDQHHVEIIYHCSECGFQAWGEGELTNFCGGCGARMIGDE